VVNLKQYRLSVSFRIIETATLRLEVPDDDFDDIKLVPGIPE
jgi:hypothetical protein